MHKIFHMVKQDKNMSNNIFKNNICSLEQKINKRKQNLKTKVCQKQMFQMTKENNMQLGTKRYVLNRMSGTFIITVSLPYEQN